MNFNRFIVSSQQAGSRLDYALKSLLPRQPMAAIRRMIGRGLVLVNDRRAHPTYRLRERDEVTVRADLSPPPAAPAKIEVLYEDAHVLVLNKPAGCAVTPERSGIGPTFLETVREHVGEARLAPGASGHAPEPAQLVHRLDRGTSGALIIARSPPAQRWLSMQFQRREVHKEYVAVVHGYVVEDESAIDLAIQVDRNSPGPVRIARRGGKKSLTLCSVHKRYRGFTRVLARPRTGRRHQVRVHLAAIGHPVLGDAVYGGSPALHLSEIKPGYRRKKGSGTFFAQQPEATSSKRSLTPFSPAPLIARPALHAWSVTFTPAECHPPVTVRAPFPTDIRRLLDALGKYAASSAPRDLDTEGAAE